MSACMISNDGSLDKEIASRISKASQALGRLRSRLLNHHNVTLDTKLKVYRAVVLSSLLYGCETWTVYRQHLKQLERFHQRALRSILGIRWQDRVTNTEVFERTNCISIEAMLLKSCLLWTGHVVRMEDHRIPKQLLFGELEQGHRRQDRPCKRFKDTVKAGLKWCGIPSTELVATALDRQRWHTLTQSASSALEKERRHQAQSARERRHLGPKYTGIPGVNARGSWNQTAWSLQRVIYYTMKQDLETVLYKPLCHRGFKASCIGWSVAIHPFSATAVPLHLTQFAVPFVQIVATVCLQSTWFYPIFNDTCNAWYMVLGPWVDLIHCSLNQSERLPTQPFDWGKLVYSVASQNPGLMRRALSK